MRVLRIPISALSHHSTLLGKRKHNALRDEHWKWFPDIFHKGLLTLGSLSWYATKFYFTETFLFSIPQKITYLLLFYTKEHQNIFFLASRMRNYIVTTHLLLRLMLLSQWLCNSLLCQSYIMTPKPSYYVCVANVVLS